MFFRRNEGEYRETDRVTRFKLIKSGKQWLRAATSNFGLFKVVKGGADTPSVTVQNVEEKSSLLSGTALLKGIAAAGAVCLAAALYRHSGGLPLILPKRTGIYRQEVAGRLGEIASQ